MSTERARTCDCESVRGFFNYSTNLAPPVDMYDKYSLIK